MAPRSRSMLRGRLPARLPFLLLVLAFLACSREPGGRSDSPAGRSESSAPAAAAGYAPAPARYGLDFPSNGRTDEDVRFRFTVPHLIPMYPATYLWRVKLRRQPGYYTTFFWGPDGPFTGKAYYGCHPYPDGPHGPGKHASMSHKWELSIDGDDIVADANGHSTQLGYDAWMTQALRVRETAFEKIHEFYWDLPDTGKVIVRALHRSYGVPPPEDPALTFGDAPWSLGKERLSGILRGIQLYSAALSLPDLLAEASAPLSTGAGKAGIWYLNLDPRPDDISDKSGRGHHPEWVGEARAALWTGP